MNRPTSLSQSNSTSVMSQAEYLYVRILTEPVLRCTIQPEMKWLVLIYQPDKCGYLDAPTVQPLITMWTTLLLWRSLLGKRASFARINRPFHLLVFPRSYVFKFEPAWDTRIRLLQRTSWVASRSEDWQIQTDLIQCQSVWLRVCECATTQLKKGGEGGSFDDTRQELGLEMFLPQWRLNLCLISELMLHRSSQTEANGEPWSQQRLWLSSINNQWARFCQLSVICPCLTACNPIWSNTVLSLVKKGKSRLSDSSIRRELNTILSEFSIYRIYFLDPKTESLPCCWTQGDQKVEPRCQMCVKPFSMLHLSW